MGASDADRTAASRLAQAGCGGAVRERLLATIRGPERFRPFVEVLRAGFGLDEDNLHDVLARIDGNSLWQSGPFPGVEYFHFPMGPTDEPRLIEAGVVRVRAGVTFPRHRQVGPSAC